MIKYNLIKPDSKSCSNYYMNRFLKTVKNNFIFCQWIYKFL